MSDARAKAGSKAGKKSKTFAGNYFEDFSMGQVIEHATPRTLTEGDVALYTALTGSRYAQSSAAIMARRNGLPAMPVDDLLAFHTVFGKTVPDISLNAVANLGYADGRFLSLVYPGETILAKSEVIGLKENSNGKTGNVYVRTTGTKNDGSTVVEYVRWVMVKKRETSEASAAKPPAKGEGAAGAKSESAAGGKSDAAQAKAKPGAPEAKAAPSKPLIDQRPQLPKAVEASKLQVPKDLKVVGVDPALTGSPYFFEDYEVGERIDHVDGMSVTETDHRLATRLYQNTAKVHFNDHAQKKSPLGKTIVYGGVVISLAKSLAFNGLGNMLHLLAINAGTHANPCVAGDTVYAWSEVLGKAEMDRPDVGALRLRLVALKDTPADGFPRKSPDGKYKPEVLLDFDYWALFPKRATKLSG